MENRSDNRKTNLNLSKKKTVLLVCLTIVAALLFWASAERHLKPVLVDAISIPEEYSPITWHSVYEAYGNHSGTFVHFHEYYQSFTPDQWPEMDLENYTYIITYGRTIQSFSYDLLDIRTAPSYNGAKNGHMVLSDEYDPHTIYVYRIPKMRINHPDL